MIESCIIIPSRYNSTRFPGKPLALIGGETMISRVLKGALKSLAETVVVATDDKRIYDECEGFATMTGEYPNGTARMIEVAKEIAADVYINLQCDEPLVSPHDLNKLISKCRTRPGVHTLMTSINPDDISNMNVVKVFCDDDSECWLFTREAYTAKYKHVGIYAFDIKTLLKIEKLEPTPNALKENLEQLTWLDHDIPIYAWKTDHKYQAVDTLEDIQKVIDILNENSLHHSNL